MKLGHKLFIPLILSVVILGGIGYWVVHGELKEMQSYFSNKFAQNKAQELDHSIEILGRQALRQAALFASLPGVVQAFEKAHEGNINDENDPNAQEARQMLRRLLKDNLSSFKEITGTSFKLHYHLPNGRSLVRLWRKKQTKKNGVWVDISDDISSFRQTVLDVNQSGKPVYGIELGRGGFVIRGLAPVKSNGKQLGSVEVLLDFNPLLKAASEGDGQVVLLYMNADKLHITQRLQDSKKYPVIDNEFVLVSGSKGKQYESLININLLHQGRRGLYLEQQGNTALAAFPVKDYKGNQIGVFVYAYDNKAITGSITSVSITIGLTLLALMLLPGIVNCLLTSIFVTRPINKVVATIKDITEDRANLTDHIQVRTRDEIGLLATWFNKLMDKIYGMMCNIEYYRYIIEAIPDPVFAVDQDYNILLANKAVARVAGENTGESLKGRKCRDIFNTKVCGTNKCPIDQVKVAQGSTEAEIIEMNIDGQKKFIKPFADILRDCDGKVIGYVEVARDVTDLVMKERELKKNLEQIERINQEVREVAFKVADTTTEISEQVEHVAEGAQIQRERVTETASAMEEMNAAVLEVAKNASNASLQVNQSREKAEQGANIVSDVVQAISEVHKLTNILKKNMDKLGSQAESIGQVMNVISDIADQTNLLALNAAIEAARAGEAGRGFAVVADEVRKLAEKTMVATKEVGEAIEAIQTGTRKNIDNTDLAAQAVQKAKELANLSGESLREIVVLVQDSSSQVGNIATAAEEQSATSEEINRAIEQISRISSETAEGMRFSAKALNNLLELAEKLRQIVDTKVDK
jgi:PAS domain S-box-containing protein